MIGFSRFHKYYFSGGVLDEISGAVEEAIAGVLDEISGAVEEAIAGVLDEISGGVLVPASNLYNPNFALTFLISVIFRP